jgi:hypothetical protein
MKLENLKSAVATLASGSPKTIILLQDPLRLNMARPAEMAVRDFVNEWDAPEDCLLYLKDSTVVELLGLADMLILMVDGTPILDYSLEEDSDFNFTKMNLIIANEEDVPFTITIKYSVVLEKIIEGYRLSTLKPMLNLKKLVKYLTDQE